MAGSSEDWSVTATAASDGDADIETLEAGEEKVLSYRVEASKPIAALRAAGLGVGPATPATRSTEGRRRRRRWPPSEPRLGGARRASARRGPRRLA